MDKVAKASGELDYKFKKGTTEHTIENLEKSNLIPMAFWETL
jgi:hypothetical protein